MDAKRQSHAAIVRACDVPPPKKGDIETSQNSFVLFIELNKTPEASAWGLKVCTSECTDVASVGTLNAEWHHIAATYVPGAVAKIYVDGVLSNTDTKGYTQINTK